jgi:hypothetical protein
MPKAILELEMPESCSECPCAQYYDTYGECGAIEYDIDGDFRPVLPDKGKRSDCPLKLVAGNENGCEYCMGENPPTVFENGETIIYYHPGHGRFLDGTYELNWKACPMCGCRLEVEQ